MDKQLSEIMHYLDEVNSFSLPKYKELPGVPLYMEQVLQFVNDALSSLSAEDAKPLTSFMVNNYVKSKIIDEPTKKTVYAKQTAEAKEKGESNCPLCAIGHDANHTKIWDLKDMDADHVTAWSKGGVTDIENCQMLCKTHNRAKGNR